VESEEGIRQNDGPVFAKGSMDLTNLKIEEESNLYWSFIIFLKFITSGIEVLQKQIE